MSKQIRPRRGASRRQFIAGASAATAAAYLGGVAPMFVPSHVLGAADGSSVSANGRINVGLIGCGGQGTYDTTNIANCEETQVVAVCDVDTKRRDVAKATFEKRHADKAKYPNFKGIDTYNDFRDLLARKDIDAVVIAVPDHWHAIPMIAACAAGKDIYGEKPLSLTIREAREIANAVRRYDRVFQVGSQQRSEHAGRFRIAAELVRNGYIGQVKEVLVRIGAPSTDCHLPAESVPEGLDWETWVGPSPWRPFNGKLHPYNWRWFRDYSGGNTTDWGAHHFDIAQWALGMDHSGPVEVHPADGKQYTVPTFKYANGVVMRHINAQGPGPTPKEDSLGLNYPEPPKESNGIFFIGDKGWIQVNRNYLKTFPDNLLGVTLGPSETKLYRSPGHHRDWVNCVQTRQRPICDVEIGARSVTVCHLSNICQWLDRPLRWDPAAERFVNDDEANRWLDRPKREPWAT